MDCATFLVDKHPRFITPEVTMYFLFIRPIRVAYWSEYLLKKKIICVLFSYKLT